MAPVLKELPEAKMPESATNTKILPHTITEAIEFLISNAQLNQLQAEGAEHRNFMRGFIMGAQAIAGIICGGIGYDLNFMKGVDDGGDSDSPTSQS